MANSFIKKDQQLKNQQKNKSVNTKMELMAQRAAALVEQNSVKPEVSEVESQKEVEILKVEETVKEPTEQYTTIEVKESPEKEQIVKTEDKEVKKSNDKNKKFKEVKDRKKSDGMPREEFLNLNIVMDRFEGSNTSVTVGIDIYDKIKEYADIKNLTINYFINKLIRVGLDDIKDLKIEDIQKTMCLNLTTKSIPFTLDDKMDSTFNEFIEKMKKSGYKLSRNTILCAIIAKTLTEFHK